jgi:cell fate (sporulation/competence/biofilm development) regulator YlbF (YheA/YmcA/DUF963 family)
MLATLERLELLENTERLAAMIVESEIVEQYRICLYRLNKSKESQRKIKRFVSIKELYEEVQRFGKYHPDYKRVMTQVREFKREMDLDPLVADFKLAENDLQNLLDEISVLVGSAVSEHIKVPTGNPFFDSGHSCSGGCGSGSCG